MARAVTATCDICQQPAEIVGKMFLTPVQRGSSAKSFHNNYQFHLDVGACCMPKVKKAWKWRKRMTARQYADARRNGSH